MNTNVLGSMFWSSLGMSCLFGVWFAAQSGAAWSAIFMLSIAVLSYVVSYLLAGD